MAPRFFGCCGKKVDAGGSKDDPAEPVREAEPVKDRSIKSAKRPQLNPTPVEPRKLHSSPAEEPFRSTQSLLIPLASSNTPDQDSPSDPDSLIQKPQEEQKEEEEDEATEQTSLWERAYDQLEDSLVREYEQLLSAELSAEGSIRPVDNARNQGNEVITQPSSRLSRDPKMRKTQLDNIIHRGEERLQQKQIRYEIAGHEFNLNEQIAGAAEFLLAGKGLVDEAVKASAEASLVWAGVCIVLPLLTHPSEASEANQAGYIYITSRLRFYVAFESSLFQASKHTTHISEKLIASLRTSVIELYQTFLEYQLKTVLRFYKRSLSRIFGDVIAPESWKEMIEKIKELEHKLHKDLEKVENRTMVQHLDETKKNVATICETMETHLQVTKEQLQVLNEIRDINQASLNLQQYGIQPEVNAMFNDRDVGSNPCQEGTRKSIRQQITDWANTSETQTVFWLNGLAGMGKSTIAQTIARHFADSRQLGATYFFKRSTARSKADHFFPTIANALIRSIPPLEHYVHQAQKEQQNPLGKTTIEGKDLATQFDTLIFRPLEMLCANSPIIWTRLLVIDALDECEKEDDTRIICELLVKLHKFSQIRFRILLTSRDEQPIGPQMRKFETEGVARSLSLLKFQTESKTDIRAYLETCMTQIKDNREVIENPWPSPEHFEQLFTLATTPSPLFIYVATFHRSLLANRSEPLQDQLKLWLANKDKKSQLASTYRPLMARLLFLHDEDTGQQRIRGDSETKLKQILGAIILLATPLPCSGLAKLLDLSLDVVENWVKNLHAVLYIETEHEYAVRILHTSFRDFLLLEAKTGDLGFFIDEKEAHRILAKSCSRLMRSTLRENICQFKDPGVLITDMEQDELKQHLPPEVQYACLYWVKHIENGNALLDSEEYEFLWTHFLHWLEAMAWLGKTSQAIEAITNLERSAPKSKLQSLSDFVHDMKRFAMFCRPIIEKAPLQVYCSAIVFAPSNSLVRREFVSKHPAPTLPISSVQGDWTALLSVLVSHSAKITALAFSTSKKLLASGGEDKNINIWDTATAAHLHTLKGHTTHVRSIAFSSDGMQLVSVSREGAVKLWDVRLTEAIYTVCPDEEYPYRPRCAAISPTCALLAIGSIEGNILMWETARRKYLPEILLPKSSNKRGQASVVAITFSPTKKILACIYQDGAVSLWNRENLDHMWDHVWSDLAGAAKSSTKTISFSSDGNTLAVTRGYGAELFKVENGLKRDEVNPRTERLHSVQHVTYSPYDPDLLALNGCDNMIQLWNTSADARALLKTLNVPSSCSSIVLLEDDRQLAAVAFNNINLWDTSLVSSSDSLYGHKQKVCAVKVSPNKDIIASTDRGTVILWVWDAYSCSIRHKLGPYNAKFWDLQFSPDGKFLAGLGLTQVKLWNVHTGDEVKLQNPNTGGGTKESDIVSKSIAKFHFSSHRTLLASKRLDYDKVARLQVLGAEKLITFKGSDEYLGDCAFTFSSDGLRLAIASHNKVGIHDTTSGERQQQYSMENQKGTIVPDHGNDKNDKYDNEKSAKVMCIVLSDDKTKVAFAMKDRMTSNILLWNVDNENSLERLDVKLEIKALTLSSNGLLAATTKDCDVILCKTAPLEELDRISLGQPKLKSWDICFSQDNSSLITNRGVVNIITNRGFVNIKSLSKGLMLQNNWITRGTNKLILLPSDYVQTCSAFQGELFVFGNNSGKVTVLDCKGIKKLWGI